MGCVTSTFTSLSAWFYLRTAMLEFPCTTRMDFFVNNCTSDLRKISNCPISKDNLILSLIVSLFCLTDHNQTPLVDFQYLRSCAKIFRISFSRRNHVNVSILFSGDFFAWVTLLDLVKRSGQLNMAIGTQQISARFLCCIIQLATTTFIYLERLSLRLQI